MVSFLLRIPLFIFLMHTPASTLFFGVNPAYPGRRFSRPVSSVCLSLWTGLLCPGSVSFGMAFLSSEGRSCRKSRRLCSLLSFLPLSAPLRLSLPQVLLFFHPCSSTQHFYPVKERFVPDCIETRSCKS